MSSALVTMDQQSSRLDWEILDVQELQSVVSARGEKATAKKHELVAQLKELDVEKPLNTNNLTDKSFYIRSLQGVLKALGVRYSGKGLKLKADILKHTQETVKEKLGTMDKGKAPAAPEQLEATKPAALRSAKTPRQLRIEDLIEGCNPSSTTPTVPAVRVGNTSPPTVHADELEYDEGDHEAGPSSSSTPYVIPHRGGGLSEEGRRLAAQSILNTATNAEDTRTRRRPTALRPERDGQEEPSQSQQELILRRGPPSPEVLHRVWTRLGWICEIRNQSTYWKLVVDTGLDGVPRYKVYTTKDLKQVHPLDCYAILHSVPSSRRKESPSAKDRDAQGFKVRYFIPAPAGMSSAPRYYCIKWHDSSESDWICRTTLTKVIGNAAAKSIPELERVAAIYQTRRDKQLAWASVHQKHPVTNAPLLEDDYPWIFGNVGKYVNEDLGISVAEY